MSGTPHFTRKLRKPEASGAGCADVSGERGERGNPSALLLRLFLFS
ncbi:MAG: hypothetical protein ACKESB_02890 [Candidatus Hodgkinia cicadicola]